MRDRTGALLETVLRVDRLRGGMPRLPLPTAEELRNDTYDGSTPVQEWRAWEAAKTERSRRISARLRGGALWAARAAALLFCAVLVVRDVGVLVPTPAIDQVFNTRAGQHRSVTLSDGSKIELGAKSAVTVQYGNARRVVLLDQGEALFTVAHNRRRPFVVFAGERTVTAVGTQFNIRRDLDLTTVTVTDGAVDVEPVAVTASRPSPTPSRIDTARLAKGQALRYIEGDTAPSVIEAADLAATLAWRNGRLVYRHVPLKYVVSDVNRYFRQQIVLGDRATGELTFSGAVLQTQSTGEFARALEAIFPVEVVETDDEHVVIRSRPTSGTTPPTPEVRTAQGRN